MNFLDEQGLIRLWEHITAKLGGKIDKVEGKGLSTNDYTNEDKELLSNLNTKVGETDVATQISNALADLDVETVTPDWNQNDSTASDYIKNRTHWKEGEIVTLIEQDSTHINSFNSELSFDNLMIGTGDRTATCYFDLSDISILKEGQLLTVNFANETFTGYLQQSGNAYVIGNSQLMDWVEVDNMLTYDTPEISGEDYCFVIINTRDNHCELEGYFKIGKFTADGYTQHSVSVTIGSETYHKIDEKFLPAMYSPIVNVNSSKTLALSDAGTLQKVIANTADTTVTITVPSNSSVAFDVNTEIEITQYGAANVTISPESGVVIASLDGMMNIGGQYGCVTLKKIGTDEWLLGGALA